MNSVETNPRFQKKFDEDRVEKQPVLRPSRPLNTLKTTRSAPVSSIPRESLLVRSPTSLLTSTVDHGLMDMSVDDGTNGNIDDTVRLLRFSTAASFIDGIFHSPQRNSQGGNPFKTEKPTCVSPAPANHTDLSPQASGKMAVSSGTRESNAKKPVHLDGNSQGPRKAREAREDASSAREKARSMIKKQPDILETEPLTPPRAEGNKLDKKADSSETSSMAKESDSAQNEDPAHESVLPVRRKLSALFSTNDVAPHVGAALKSKIAEGKRLSDKGQGEGANNEEVAESPVVDSSGGRVSPKDGDRPNSPNFFRRRSTVKRQTPIDVESGSGRDHPGSSEHNRPATSKGARKLKMLVKKLSSGFREKASGERKVVSRPSGKAPTPTVKEAAVPPAGNVHAGKPDSCESSACGETRPDLFAQQLALSGGSRNAVLDQPTQSASGEQAKFTNGDRQILQKFLKGFSFGSKDRTSETKGVGHAEVRQDSPNKGALFAKLFRRKSTTAEEKESETGNTPCPEEGGTSDTPGFSIPLESQTRWSQLSQKVTRFLGMLVH